MLSLRARILSELAAHGQVTAAWARTVAVELGLHDGVQKKAIRRMCADGVLVRAGDGVYRPGTATAGPGRKASAYVAGTAPLTPDERARGEDLSDVDTSGRPTSREQCVSGQRPCPWASCRYHLAVDVTIGGGLTVCHPDVDVADLEETCALDVAARGGVTLDEVAEILNVSKERARQIEESAIRRLRRVSRVVGRAWRDMR